MSVVNHEREGQKVAPCYDERIGTSARFCPERRYRCSGGRVETRSDGTRALSAERIVPVSAKPIEIDRLIAPDCDKPNRVAACLTALSVD